MNIQDKIGKGFGSWERAYYMWVNDYSGPRRTNRPHATPKYGPRKYKFEVKLLQTNILFYRKKSLYPEKKEK